MAYKPLKTLMVAKSWATERRIIDAYNKCAFCGRKFLFHEAYIEHVFVCKERQKILYPQKKDESSIQVSILEF